MQANKGPTKSGATVSLKCRYLCSVHVRLVILFISHSYPITLCVILQFVCGRGVDKLIDYLYFTFIADVILEKIKLLISFTILLGIPNNRHAQVSIATTEYKINYENYAYGRLYICIMSETTKRRKSHCHTQHLLSFPSLTVCTVGNSISAHVLYVLRLPH